MSQTPVPITGGSGTSSVAAELVNGTSYQEVEIYGAGGASVLTINPDGSIKASIIGTPSFTFSGSPSISGAVTIVGTPSISGSVTIVGTPSISGAVTVVGTPSISGTVNIAGLQGASVSGSVGIVGTPSISGTVQIAGNPSISGTVNAAQQGAWSVSIAGGFVTPLAPKASWVSGVTSVLTGTGLTSVLVAAGGSIKNYMSHIIVTNAAAAGTFVDIKDGGGNVIYSGFAAASGGGFSSNINPPIPGSANKSVDIQPRAQASIIAVISGYTDL